MNTETSTQTSTVTATYDGARIVVTIDGTVEKVRSTRAPVYITVSTTTPAVWTGTGYKETLKAADAARVAKGTVRVVWVA